MGKTPKLWSSIVSHWEIARSLRGLKIHFDANRCKGAWQCYNVCPIACWTPDRVRRVVTFHNPERCIACGACVLQCPQRAIELR
jgi:NAD-dependent dihydropyrimidine dehydrogenase PreA subunit